MVWPPATYDVLSRNHSNWPSAKRLSKYAERINEQLQKSSCADALTFREKNEKNYVRGFNSVAKSWTDSTVVKLQTNDLITRSI